MKLTIKRFLLFTVVFLFIGGISVNVFASPIKSASNEFYADNNIDENLDVKADVYVAGNSIRLSGKVGSDILVAGNIININTENIGGSLRAAGSSINIGSKIDGNITAIAGNINIKEETKANGIYIGGSNIIFLGEAEDLYISGDKVELNGTITGNVDINCSELIIGENTRIDGTFKVKGEKEPIILGDFDTNKIEFTQIATHEDISFSFKGISVLNKVITLITSILLAVLIMLLCKRYISKSVGRLEYKPWLPFIIGFASLVIVPIAALVICFTIIAIPVSVIALIIYVLLIYLAPIISGILLGRILLKSMNTYISGIICTIIIKLLAMVPYIRGVLIFICILLSLGVFVQNIFGLITEREN